MSGWCGRWDDECRAALWVRAVDRLILAAAIAVVAVAVAVVLERRRGPAPMTVRRGAVPSRVDLAAVDAPARPAVVLFTEATCATCAAAREIATAAAGAWSVIEVEYGERTDVHRAHGIDTVPTTVVVDGDGVVVAGWTGRLDAGLVAAAVAAVTRPGDGRPGAP